MDNYILGLTTGIVLTSLITIIIMRKITKHLTEIKKECEDVIAQMESEE